MFEEEHAKDLLLELRGIHLPAQNIGGKEMALFLASHCAMGCERGGKRASFDAREVERTKQQEEHHASSSSGSV